MSGSHRAATRTAGLIAAASMLLTGLAATSAQAADYVPPKYFSPTSNADASLAYFAGYAPYQNVEPFVTDGTVDGTRMLRIIGSYTASSMANPERTQFVSIGTKTFFFASNHGVSQLWVTDGTNAGTKQLTTGSAGGRSTLEMAAFNGELYFSGKDAAHGLEVWHSDGTVAGTGLAMDIGTGTTSTGAPHHSWPDDFVVAGGKLFFFATDGLGARGLYATSDGESATRLADWTGLSPTPNQITALDGALVVPDDITGFLTSDGTPGGTGTLAPSASSSSFAPVMSFDGHLFYSSTSSLLTRLDGTTKVPISSEIVLQYAVSGGKLYFVEYSYDTRRLTLFVMDSATATPVELGDIGASSSPFLTFRTVALDGLTYFWSYTGLWKTDGTPEGTEMVHDFGFGRSLVFGMELAVAGDSIVLTGQDWSRNSSMWLSDGTDEGTVQVLATGVSTAPKPVLTGTVAVGSKVGGRIGTWTPSNQSFTYQWKLNGVAIPGENGRYYTPVAANAGKKLSVTITGWAPGYRTKTVTSDASVVLRTFTTVPTPTISGSKVAGNVLTAKPGAWTPMPTSFAYVWYADGKVIKGATASTYTVTESSAKKKIAVKVTGTRSGYVTASKTSAAK